MNKILLGIFVVAIIGLSFFFVRDKVLPLSQQTQSETASPQITNAEMLESAAGMQVETKDVTYFENVNGFYAKPSSAGNYPGVVMIHEWWGLNDHIKDMARQLASQGYHVLAVDLYDGKIAVTPQDARKYTTSLNKTRAVQNMKSAVSYLKSQGATKMASLGWCFGGGQSLQLALSGESLDATVIYYGTLETDTKKLSTIKQPVLGIFGDKDQSIPASSVKQFGTALTQNGTMNEIYLYPGVGHAFANPSGDNYAPTETKDAWEKTTSFLAKYLKS